MSNVILPNSSTSLARFVLNVKDYGAIGDGVANDSAAVAAGIAAIPSSGGMLFFPAGTYKANVIVSSKNDVSLMGAGNSSVISPSSGVGISITSASRTQVSNLRVTAASNGISISGAGQSQFYNLMVDTCTIDGFLINGDNPTEITFTDCISRGHSGIAWHYTRTNGTDTGGIYFTHCLGTNCAAGSWKFESSNGSATKAYAWLNQCVADGFTSDNGFVIDNVDDVRASQLWAVGTTVAKACIRLNNAHQIVLTDVRSYQNSASGYTLELAGTTQFAKISGDFDGLGTGFLFTGTSTNDLDLTFANNASATKTSGTTNTRPGISTIYSAPWQGFFNPASIVNKLYYHAVQVSDFCKLTGISYYIDTTAAGNVKVGLYDTLGNLVASSGSVALGSSFATQFVPFTSVYMALKGRYFVSVMPDTVSVKFGSGWTLGAAGAATQGAFTIPATITVPAPNVSVQLPTMSTY